MRPLTVAGLVLLVLGGFILLRGLSYTSRQSVFQVGEFKATMEERQAVPTWIGALALAGGIALLVGGRRRRD
jgi:LPXTG-motif cell wall-anchored protein